MIWHKFYDLCEPHLWLWRPVCWIKRTHKNNDCLVWNYGRTYCAYCDKTFKKDQWRIDRDKAR